MVRKPALWVMLALLIIAVLFSFQGGISAIQNERLPFGMEHEVHTNAIFIGVLFVVLGGITAAACFFLIRYLLTGRNRQLTNVFLFISWLLALFIFIYGVGASGVEWFFFFLFTIPAFVAWIMTGASIRTPGESW